MLSLVVILVECRLSARANGVVPLWTDLMRLQVQGGHLFVGNFETRWVVVRDQACLHGQARLRGRLTNVSQRELEGAQRTTRPGLADLAEQSVLNRIPFGGAGRIMADRDGQAKAIGHLRL